MDRQSTQKWIAGETPRLHTAAGSLQPQLCLHQHSTPHLISDASSCFFATDSTPKHRTPPSAALSHAGHDCCCACPQSCCALPSASHHTDPIRCLAPLLAAPKPIATARPSAAQPAASAHIANLSVPSATCRGCVLLCAHIPRSPFLTGLSIEERGGGLFEVFEILYRSATPQSAVL